MTTEHFAFQQIVRRVLGLTSLQLASFCAPSGLGDPLVSLPSSVPHWLAGPSLDIFLMGEKNSAMILIGNEI